MTEENITPGAAGISNQKLLLLAISRYVMAVLFVAVIIFLPAGSFAFWNGWLFLATLFLPMSVTLFYLFKKDPELLKKRLNLKERQKEQKFYIKMSVFLYILAYMIPGLDFRYQWSQVPLWLVVSSTVVMIFGYFLFVLVMRQNTFASRVIEVQQGQKVIDTGLYAIVRHPMYMAALVLYLPSPFVLGSWYMIFFVFLFLFALVYRIVNEEKFLKINLPGYEDYMNRVRYRMIPFVW